MEIKTWKVEIENQEGFPMLQSRPGKDLMDEIKKTKKNELSEWEENNWQRKAYTENGNVVLPATHIKGCLVNACKHTKIVPYFATKKNETWTRYIEDGMQISGALVEANGTKGLAIGKVKDLKPYGAFTGAQGKNSATKVWRIRPLLETWKVSFELIDPFGRIRKQDLLELFEYAGVFEGVGDGRKIGFGRFTVKTIKEVKTK